MDEELLKRARDLAYRCEKTAGVTNTGFLAPSQSYELNNWAKHGTDCTVLFRGGHPDAERRAAFFLPDWMDEDSFDEGEYICALECVARFGSPGHRDWLGAVLGLGIERDRLGDILIDGETAWIFCLPSVKQHLLLNLDKVGHWGVKVREIPLADVPQQKRKMKELVFSVKSPRLDAVCAGMFGTSRTAAAEAITQGSVTHNYAICLKCDAQVREGDILSMRGRGKGIILDAGGAMSRRGRMFVRAGIYL